MGMPRTIIPPSAKPSEAILAVLYFASWEMGLGLKNRRRQMQTRAEVLAAAEPENPIPPLLLFTLCVRNPMFRI